jgi:hypothetical protein
MSKISVDMAGRTRGSMIRAVGDRAFYVSPRGFEVFTFFGGGNGRIPSTERIG